MRLSKPQQRALLKAYRRQNYPVGSFLKFRRNVHPMLCGQGAIVVPWCGMWLAIEPDGYTHS